LDKSLENITVFSIFPVRAGNKKEQKAMPGQMTGIAFLPLCEGFFENHRSAMV